MTAGKLLLGLAFYVAAMDLALRRGFIGTIASTPSLLLLAGAGLLAGRSALRAARDTRAAPLARAARVLFRAGVAVAVVSLPVSLTLREPRTFSAGEGEEIPSGPGVPPIQFGQVTLAPRGPHLLSKTVEIAAAPAGEPPTRIGLFPPTSLAGRRWSVFRFGFAPGFQLFGPDGEPLAGGYVKLGTLPQQEETASLVTWTPEANLMMGAGTFPPRLEDLASPPGTGHHVFLRLVEATLGGVRRDLTDPEAYRWLLDGRPEDPVLAIQVFRGRERLFDGRVRGGDVVTFPGGTLEIAPDVLLWVDLLAIRDPFLPAALAGMLVSVAGLALSAGLAVIRRLRVLAART